MAHNHGPEEGPGLSCPERRVGDRLRGRCLDDYEPTDAELAARGVNVEVPDPGNNPSDLDRARWEGKQ